MFLIALHVNFMCFISVPSEPTAPESETLVAFSNRISMLFPAFLFSLPFCLFSKIHARRYDKCRHNLTRKEKKHCFICPLVTWHVKLSESALKPPAPNGAPPPPPPPATTTTTTTKYQLHFTTYIKLQYVVYPSFIQLSAYIKYH